MPSLDSISFVLPLLFMQVFAVKAPDGFNLPVIAISAVFGVVISLAGEAAVRLSANMPLIVPCLGSEG